MLVFIFSPFQTNAPAGGAAKGCTGKEVCSRLALNPPVSTVNTRLMLGRYEACGTPLRPPHKATGARMPQNYKEDKYKHLEK